jgi:hypothetical protein
VNRITDVKIHGKPIDELPPASLLRIAMPAWVAPFLPRVKDFTRGMFDFSIFDADGRPLSIRDLPKRTTPFYEYILFSNALAKLQSQH